MWEELVRVPEVDDLARFELRELRLGVVPVLERVLLGRLFVGEALG